MLISGRVHGAVALGAEPDFDNDKEIWSLSFMLWQAGLMKTDAIPRSVVETLEAQQSYFPGRTSHDAAPNTLCQFASLVFSGAGVRETRLPPGKGVLAQRALRCKLT